MPFISSAPIYTGLAPGRLDVMGGIADYSGALVLQMPLNLYTRVQLQKRTDTKILVHSTEGTAEFDIRPLLAERGAIVENGNWRSQNLPNWALYVLGCIFVLLDEREFAFQGLSIKVDSEVPIGKGVSSSAALEVATMSALYQAFNLPLGREALALLAQRAENYVAGAPCGIMDQMAVHLGRKNKLLPILCQPDQVFEPVEIPSGLQFFGLDTGVKHAVGDGVYGRVRTAAFMGLTMIQYHMKKGTSRHANSSPIGKYLANIPLDLFNTQYASLLPSEIRGDKYLEQYPLPKDKLSRVEADKTYPVSAATSHPIKEHHRITAFKKALEGENPDPDKLGDWMLESHQGYVDCGLSCPEADFIVDTVKERRSMGEVFGARITGGGSGGTVCLLARSEAAVREIKSIYEKAFDRSVSLFSGSGDGAFYL